MKIRKGITGKSFIFKLYFYRENNKRNGHEHNNIIYGANWYNDSMQNL